MNGATLFEEGLKRTFGYHQNGAFIHHPLKPQLCGKTSIVF